MNNTQPKANWKVIAGKMAHDLEAVTTQRNELLGELKLIQSQLCQGRSLFALMDIIRCAISKAEKNLNPQD